MPGRCARSIPPPPSTGLPALVDGREHAATGLFATLALVGADAVAPTREVLMSRLHSRLVLGGFETVTAGPGESQNGA